MDTNPNMGSVENTSGNAMSPGATPHDSATPSSKPIAGLTVEEQNDHNKIQITLRDSEVPIVVLFGPPACGKTMTLVRLSRYLRDVLNYTVQPDNKFRPDDDVNYQKMCSEFNDMLSSDQAAKSTSNMSFMLVRVLDKHGNLLVQLLEAPGELYYNPNDKREPNVDFPRPVRVIRSSKHRKIWCHMLEPNWEFHSQAGKYVDKIKKLHSSPKVGDSNIFIFNKVDESNFVISTGVVNSKAMIREIDGIYPNIFVPFTTHGIFGTSFNFQVVPFQTGEYCHAADGTKSFDPGPDEYPALLWKVIYKLIRG